MSNNIQVFDQLGSHSPIRSLSADQTAPSLCMALETRRARSTRNPKHACRISTDDPSFPGEPRAFHLSLAPSRYAMASGKVFEEHLGVISALKDNFTRQEDAETLRALIAVQAEIKERIHAHESEVQQAIQGTLSMMLCFLRLSVTAGAGRRVTDLPHRRAHVPGGGQSHQSGVPGPGGCS